MNYLIDNTAPTIGTPFPQGWVPPSTSVGAALQDQGGSSIDAAASTITVDSQSLPTSYAGGVVRAQASGLSEGLHQASIFVKDVAGNSRAASFSFNVDATAPALANPNPTGTISSRSPLLRVAASDIGGGVDPATITMHLSYLFLSSEVPATYDPDSATISYQVPESLSGLGIGRFPLLDGEYIVSVQASDIVGNTSQLRWSFVVQTLPL